MSLSAASAAMGIPEPLVSRAAAARAAAAGVSTDEILAAWAGGEAAPAGAPSAPSPEPLARDEPAQETVEPSPASVPAPVMETAPASATAVTRAPIPSEVTPGEATHLPEVITVPTAGIRERTNFVIPKWLTAIFLVAPLFALFALGGSATGQCGEATELQADVVTGDIVNCDGTPFTGQAIGGGGTDYVALGEQIYGGTAVAGVNCSGCHGQNGQGVGNFPALGGVITTFGACEDHLSWVTLGSDNWKAQVGQTYGDTGKQVGGGMPSFATTLSEEQIAAVVAFERVRFGQADATATLTECGLVETPEEGDAATEGGDGAEASAVHSG